MTSVDTNGRGFGLLCGATMAVGASLTFAAARAGILAGMAPEALILLRFTVSGLFYLPLVLRWGFSTLAGIGWPRGMVLLLTGGPAFVLLQLGGYVFAPLAHGAVIAPSAVTIISTGLAAVFLRERLSRAHLSGAALVIGGIVLLTWEGLAHSGASQAWIGDLMFLASSVLWAVFSFLLRLWRLQAARAIGVVSVLSLGLMLPGFAALGDVDRLLAVPTGMLAAQVLVQGLLQGIIGLTAYGHAIRVLGVSRAVLFPAAVPAISVLVGIPIAGEWPNMTQVAGLMLVTFGLFIAVAQPATKPSIPLVRVQES